MATRVSLIASIKNYSTSYFEENLFIDKFLELLEHPRACYRDHQPGHITGSSWIIDETKKFTLLTHHAKLNKWLQPGGHADGDEDIANVALREAKEETGLNSIKLLLPTIFDLDVHTIPTRKDFPQHLHFDIRFLFHASRNEKLIVTEESHALAWIPLNELSRVSDNNASMIRMAEKVTKLF